MSAKDKIIDEFLLCLLGAGALFLGSAFMLRPQDGVFLTTGETPQLAVSEAADSEPALRPVVPSPVGPKSQPSPHDSRTVAKSAELKPPSGRYRSVAVNEKDNDPTESLSVDDDIAKAIALVDSKN